MLLAEPKLRLREDNSFITIACLIHANFNEAEFITDL